MATATRRKPATRKTTTRKPAARKPQTRKSAPRKRPVARKRSAPQRRGRLLPVFSWRHRILAVLALTLAAGAGYMFWLRDSSLVAVTDVEVVGVTTSDRAEIVGALTGAAKDMTTLHTDTGRLASIAGRFPTVAGIDIDPNFPHGMRIEVRQRPPRLLADAGGDEVPIAADGTVLAGVAVPDDQRLPVLPLDQLPPKRLEGAPLEQAVVVGATPDPLLGLIEKIDRSDEFGVAVTLRGGIEVRFGDAERAEDKWAAVAAVLADPKLDCATYVDVRVPERPAVGGAC
jgi:cell division septal protein FtsQ